MTSRLPDLRHGPSRAATGFLTTAGLIALLGGCAGAGPQSRETRADNAACRSTVSAAYDRQNRADYYRPSQTDSPFSGSGTPGVTSAGLGQQYRYDDAVQSCERGSAANVSGSNAAGHGTATPTITVMPPAH